MKKELLENALDVAEQKIPAVIASGGTVVTGISTYNSWLPSVIGMFGTIVGIIVSCILLYFSVKKMRAEMKQVKLVTTIISRKEEERLLAKEEGVELRRFDDQLV